MVDFPKDARPPAASYTHEELVQWSSKLFRTAYHVLHQEQDAREVVQEVFRKMLEHLDTFEGRSSLYTWLYRVAVNESLMRLRSRKSHPTVAIEDILPHYEDGVHADVIPDWSPLPDEQLATAEAQRFLQECIQQLPEEWRVAYILKDVEELPEDEVCKILEVTKPTMKNRVHRARLFLRKKIEGRYVR